MAEKHAFQSEMTEENNGVVIFLIYFIIMAFSLITMLCQNLIEFSGHMIVHFLHMTFLHGLVLKPVVILEKALVCHPVLGQPVPCNNFLILHIRAPDLAGEFLKPLTYHCGSSHFFQGWGCGVPGSSKR